MIKENIMTINMDNGTIVKIIKGNVDIRYCETKELIEDLFSMKKNYKSKELIPLSRLCDCVFDLLFCGSSKVSKEIYFKVC
jgi:hypothetical protein